MNKYLVLALFVFSFQFSVGLVSAQVSTNEGRMRMKKIEAIENKQKREIVKDVSQKACAIKEKRLLEAKKRLDGLTKTLTKYRNGRVNPDLLKQAQADIVDARGAIETANLVNCIPSISSSSSSLRDEVKLSMSDLEDKIRLAQASVKKAALSTVSVMQNVK